MVQTWAKTELLDHLRAVCKQKPQVRVVEATEFF